MRQELKNNNFIKKSISMHGKHLFNYSNINYINTTTQLNITCNKHGISFMITPVSHFKGIGGCPLCQKSFQQNQKIKQKFITNEGYEIEIIDYITNTNCTILFNDGTILENKGYSEIKRGQIKNPKHPFKLGVGYMGVGHYSSNRHLKAYRRWYNMLNRSYNDKKQFKTYKDVTVCEEWHNFQNFAKWYEENYIEGFELDKDILVKGNKIYSPETCCFVPHEINALFIKSNSTRGKYPIGVKPNKKRFAATFAYKHLGTYDTPELAFEVYKTAKEAYIKEIADKWRDKISEKVYQALINYQVEITD